MTEQFKNIAPKGDLQFEDRVIEKIVGYSLENVDGLLAVDGGFFSNLKNKVVSNDDVTTGINVEVGKKQVAVDLDIIVEYGKHVVTIFDDIKNIVAKEVAKMTDLEVVEVNVTVVDIKTKSQHEEDSVSLQDKVVGVANSTGDFAAKQAKNIKSAVNETTNKVSENIEPRVK